MRPLSDRVEGIDAVLRPVVAACTPLHASALRVAAATFVRVHGELLDYLVDGGQPALLVADGLVGYWPDDVEVGPDGPLHGAELVPVACTVLDELAADAADALAGAATVLPELRDSSSEFHTAVTVELLEALVFAAATRGLDATPDT